jgi:hypothetical protein
MWLFTDAPHGARVAMGHADVGYLAYLPTLPVRYNSGLVAGLHPPLTARSWQKHRSMPVVHLRQDYERI